MSVLAAMLTVVAVAFWWPLRRRRWRLRADTDVGLARWWDWLRQRMPGRGPSAGPDEAVAWELLAGCLAAGLPLSGACRVVAEAMSGPAADELTAVLRRLEVGMTPAEAWLAAQPRWGPVARDVARAAHSGAAVAESLRMHAVGARQSRRAAAMVTAREAGVRSILPMIVCFLPSFVLVGVVPLLVSVAAGLFS